MPTDPSPKLPSIAQYVQALRAVLKRLSDPQLKMLRAHFQAPENTITTHDLSLAAGFQNWKPVNMHYGLVGSLLRDELGSKGDVGGQKSYVFVHFLPPTAEKPGWRWVLHKRFREALAQLAWFDEELLGVDVADTLSVAAREGALTRRFTLHRHREGTLRLAKLALQSLFDFFFVL